MLAYLLQPAVELLLFLLLSEFAQIREVAQLVFWLVLANDMVHYSQI